MPHLFTIDTPQVHLTWSRRKDAVVPVRPEEAAAVPFGLQVDGLQHGVEPVVHRSAAAGTHLFEETDYVLFVQSRGGRPVRVYHRDPVLLRGLHTSDGGRVQHGTVNFGGQVGRSRFVVELGQRPHLAFEVEVFPSKLDYRADYAALRADVQAITRSLALAYLRATRQPGTPVADAASDDLAWTLLLRAMLDDLADALTYLVQHPLWDTDRTVQMTRTDRIQHPDPAVRRAIRRGRGAGGWLAVGDGFRIREQLPMRRARYTLDTPEHRWLAVQLHRMRVRLAEVIDLERSRSHRRRVRIVVELTEMMQRIDRLATLPPFREAGEIPPPEPTLRLLTAPGYREAYQACLRLQQSLHVGGDVLALSLKDLHELYEVWCFLTLVRLTAEITGRPLPWRDLLHVEHDGLRVRLRRGRSQTVTFSLARGRTLTLAYNPRFGGRGYLVPQQPDVLLTLHAPGKPDRRFVLDAKYRLDASPGYVQRYGTPGPPTDALNTLHRYRDAIRDADGRRSVEQAVALFPYHTGASEGNHHIRSLADIGIGALPLLPETTEAVAGWLREVLRE